VKLYQVEVARYTREYTTVYVYVDDNVVLDPVVDPQLSDAIRMKAQDLDFEVDYDYTPDCEIVSVYDAEELSGTTIDDVHEYELVRLEETDNE